ncbi:MAG: ABC transporter ATP-binding protein [Candidatus Lokiarchaeota archaeon]|nr:ABC transporter ATP-binding protein [Candidatus Lokiarchaeota archaeon]
MVKELPVVMIREIGYSYPNGTEALKNINLNIFKGELVGIMGKNGAGKTSLIRTLNGLIRPTYGTIYIDNENISSKSIATLSKKVGIIFQNPFHQLFANSVEEEIKFSLKSFNLGKEEIQSKTDRILREFNLEKYRNRSPLNLSGGESKKLAMASIICRDPEILVFDEPTLGQDAKEIDFFINLITSERKKGKTIIIITHNVEFAYEYLPRTILMADGQIIVDGPTKKVLNNEFLIKQTSLILPQIRQFNLVLQQNEFYEVEDVLTTNEMIDYLRNLIKHKSSNI